VREARVSCYRVTARSDAFWTGAPDDRRETGGVPRAIVSPIVGFVITDERTRTERSHDDRPPIQASDTPIGLCDVGDELDQASVGVAEVDARTSALSTVSRHWSLLDLDVVLAEVRGRALDRSRPFEAEVAVSRRYRDPSDGIAVCSRTVHVELLSPESIGPRAGASVDQFRPEHIAVEDVRSLPIGHVDDAMVELREHVNIVSAIPGAMHPRYREVRDVC
jgi:hypothetical protein